MYTRQKITTGELGQAKGRFDERVVSVWRINLVKHLAFHLWS